MENISECIICEDEESFYKNICIKCYKMGFEVSSTVNTITIDEIYSYYVDINEESIKDLFKLKELIEFKRFILDKLSNAEKHNRRLEIKCHCGEIYPRDLSYGEEPHTILCSNCGPRCSNCIEDTHPNITCKKRTEIQQFYNSGFIQSWLENLKSEGDEVKRILFNEKARNLDMSDIKIQDIRQCPYAEYETARKYENSPQFNLSSKLTDSHNEETWHKVACQADPTMKTACASVTCDNRHMLQKNKKTKCCGRSSNWDYWKKVIPKVLNEKVTSTEIKKSDLRNVSCANYNVNSYTCNLCNKEKKLLSLTCLNSKCDFFQKKKCIDCAIFHEHYHYKETITVHYRSTLKDGDYEYVRYSPTDSFVGENPTNEFTKGNKAYIIVKKISGLLLYSQPSTTSYYHGRFRNKALGGNIKSIDNLKKPDTYLKDYVTKKNMEITYKLTKHNCFKLNHLMMFDPTIEKIQYNLANIEKYKTRVAAGIIIIKFIKSIVIVCKWRKISRDIVVFTKAVKIIHKVVKSHLALVKIRCRIIKIFIEDGSCATINKNRLIKRMILEINELKKLNRSP